MPICLPDTSCLIHLDRIDQFDLLPSLYDDLRILPAVKEEYGTAPEGVRVVEVSNTALVRLLRRTVDAGEGEIIAVGTQLKGTHVVLDDARPVQKLRTSVFRSLARSE